MKKDETRFTIRFNPIDPRHQMAMNALKAAGRRKSTLIADALCEYLTRNGCGMVDTHLPLTLPPIPVSNVTAQEVEPLSQILRPEADENENNSHADQPFDDDMREAVLGGLSAFKI